MGDRHLIRRSVTAYAALNVKQATKTSGGKELKAPDSTPKAQDQVNLTDPKSRIMPVSGGGFEQSYCPGRRR